MCAIEREDFETLGLDFKEHVAAQHNMWDYLFFRLYLESKDPVDFTGLETYCWEQQQKGRIHWFPIEKAIIIEGCARLAPFQPSPRRSASTSRA